MIKDALNQVISVVICGELFSEGHDKVRDHDHVTGKYSGSVQKDCHINLRLTKNSCNISALIRL